MMPIRPVRDLEVAVELIKPSVEEGDEWETPIFAFHDLDYIPSGYGGILAPYIETGPGSECRGLSPLFLYATFSSLGCSSNYLMSR